MLPSEIEKRKLFANWLSGASGSCLTAGVIAPIAAAIYMPNQTQASGLIIGIGVICWLSAAVALHLFARIVLEGLDP